MATNTPSKRKADIVADSITSTGEVTGSNLNISNWDIAHGWGNHASAGYITSIPSEYLTQTEGDSRYYTKTVSDLRYAQITGDTFTGNVTAPTFTGSLRGALTGAPDATIWCVSGQYDDWGIFYDEGNPDKIQYRSGGTTTATIALDTGAGYFNGGLTTGTNGDIATGVGGDLVAYGHVTASYGYVSASSGASGGFRIGGTRKDLNWDTAYGWGNHASAGYLPSAHDMSLTLSGDASGSATFTNMGNATLNVTVANDSHTHDGRYYTETESNNTFLKKGSLGLIGNSDVDFGTTSNWANNPVAGFYKTDYVGYSGLVLMTGDVGGSTSSIGIEFAYNGKVAIHSNTDSNRWDSTRVFTDAYHPNADKWTTARTHTVTLTGQVTGSASQSVDGTGNRTWNISTTLNDSALDDQYVTVGSRHTGNASGLVQTNKASIRIWDVSTASDDPSGASDGLVLSAGWDSSSWGVQQYHDFHTNDLYLRSKQNGTFSSWEKVWSDGNDGSGSGLDADLLDGLHASAFASASHNHDYLPLSGGTITGNVILTGTDGENALTLSGTSPTLALTDTGSEDDFYIHVNGNNFYVLRDAVGVGGYGAWTSPHPLQLEGDTNRGYLFGQRMFADNYHPNADKWTTARTLSLTGDVTGSVSWDGSANASITTTVANDSHTHDGRYYTESEADSRFVNVTGDTISGNLHFLQNPVGTTYGQGVSAVPTRYISQQVGDNDGWRLYGEAPASNDVKMIFEVVDDNETGDTWVFRNKRTYSPYTATEDFKITGEGHIRARGNGYVNTSQRVFADNYHPNADKWTTARSHTVTLTGDVTGSATQSVDGTGNKTWSITTAVVDDSHFHHRLDSTDDRDVKPNTSGVGSGVQAIKPFFTSLGGMTGSANTDYQDLLVLDTYSDTSGGNANAITMDKSDGSMRIWNASQNASSWGTSQRVFADNYHPNADKWTTARSITLSGDLTGSVSLDGSSNVTLSAQVVNDSHTHDTRYVQQGGTSFSGEYGMVVRVSDRNFYSDGNIKFRGSDSRLTVDGIVNTPTYQVNGTTVIDSSRNLTNIGTIRSGKMHTSYGLEFNNGNTDFLMYNNTGENVIYLRDLTNAQMLTTWSTSATTIHKALDVSGDIRKGGTTVIDSSRNATFNQVITPTLKVGDGNDGYFYSDTNGRTAFASGDFYIQSSVGNYYNYATNQYHGNSSGDNHYFRSNTLSGTNWDINSSGDLSARSFEVSGTTVIDSSRNALNLTSIQMPSRNGSVSMSLNDGALHVRSFTDKYHKIWYYDGIAFGTNSGHGHFRFYAETNTQRNASSGGAYLRFDIDSVTGNCTASGNITAYSDIKLKENINTISSPLDKVLSLRGVTYNRKDREDDRLHMGVIAQEVEKVIPEVVDYQEETDTKTVSYGNMVGLLIEAIKEQQVQIDELKSKLEK